MSTAPATPSITHSVPAAAVKAVRRFNRAYTRRAGVLEPYLDGELSLTEVRVLYELVHHEALVATELARLLGLDGGYLSRVLKKFERAGWLTRTRDARDGRQSVLNLTDAGRAAFAPMEQKSRDEAAALLAPLKPRDRTAVVEAMARIERLLDPAQASVERTRTIVLRDPAPGDLGWVVQQHGEIYAREYGWNAEFEGLVAGIVGDFVRKFDPAAEKCWIAEIDGEKVGAVFVVRKSSTTAQLRMLVLTPAARGLGLGGRLVDECIAFARAKGYRKMVLWTNRCLDAARAIYARRGFELVKSEAYEGFGQRLIGETWQLVL